MRRYRLLGVAIFGLLPVLVGCHSTTYTVVPPGGITGASAKVGDKLVWATLYPTDPGYTVKFPAGKSPCGKDYENIPVTAGKPNGCTVVEFPEPHGPNVFFYYTIDRGSPGPLNQRTNEIPFSVVSCKGCASVFSSSDSDGNRAMVRANGSNYNPALITCADGKAHVDQSAVDQKGSIWWSNRDGYDWTADFGSDAQSPCTDGHIFTSVAPGKSTCDISPTASGPYPYKVTLLNTPSCTGSGDGTLTVSASFANPPAQ